MIKNIENLENVFDSFAPSERNPGVRDRRLERMERLLSYLKNPEKEFRTYHIAGSKGKGSSGAYIASLLSGSGRKCGLYTSPHLFTIRERFTLCGEFFPDSLYIESCNELLDKISSFTLPSYLGPEKPTVFEIYTAYGYMLFKNSGCTDAVIETGLGGRLDATNTIKSEAVFLTPIELEHQDILGNTIEEIAGEKAGIITTNAPVFVSLQKDEAEKVFRKKANEMNAPLFMLKEHLDSFIAETTKDGEKTSFSIDGHEYSLLLRMSTEKMAENAALAILGADKLGFLTTEGLKQLENMTLPGRFEKRIIDGKLCVIDTAHTPASAAATREAFIRISGKCPTLIFSLISGKNEEEIMKELFPPFETIFITKPSDYKKSDPDELYERARNLFPDKRIFLQEDPNAALNSALSLPSDILITGSFYLACGLERIRKGL